MELADVRLGNQSFGTVAIDPADSIARTLRSGLYEHQRRIDVNRDPAALRLAEAEDRRACDELVLDDPE